MVTEASSGIGRALAQHLAGEGVHVVVAARSADRLREIGQSLNARYGVEHPVVPVDLSDGSGAQRLIHATEDLDVGVLISNAGDGMPQDFLDHPPIVTRIGLRRSDFPLSLMAPDAAVEQAMRALIAGTATLVPGRALRLALGAMPRGASVRLNGKIMARAMARNTPPASTAEPAA